jgi:hypothetical protein
MSKTYLTCLVILLITVLLGACSKNNEQTDLTADQAIKIARNEANRKNYDTKNCDIEILRVKKGVEKGPIRLITLFQSFPRDLAPVIAKGEFWVIYFYPKGELEKAHTLGGDFITLLDLHSGKVIEAIAGK